MKVSLGASLLATSKFDLSWRMSVFKRSRGCYLFNKIALTQAKLILFIAFLRKESLLEFQSIEESFFRIVVPHKCGRFMFL